MTIEKIIQYLTEQLNQDNENDIEIYLDTDDYKVILQALVNNTGYWIKSDIGGAKVCSVCQAHMGLSNFKYCPNCGCRMVKPQESEDKK